MPAPGTVFQLIGESHHIWVVASRELNGKVLCVNFTDAAKCLDSPCQVSAGEHRSIVKPSAVFYRKAREFTAANIDAQLLQGAVVKHEDCTAALLKKIVNGAFQADDLTARFLDYFS